MADGGIIRIGTEVDISGIKAGMAEAEATIKSSTTAMEQTYKTVAAATLDYASKQNVLRDAIRQNLTGALPYNEAMKVLPPILMENAAASQALRAAKLELAAAEKSDTEAVQTNMSARMAASSEMRVFEGSMMGSTRAAGAFLTMLPGMSAMMQAAFPIFGVVALVEVLGQAVGAVERLVTAYKDLDGAAIKASTDAIIAGEKIVKVKAARFDANAFARAVAGAGDQPDITVQNAAAKLKEIQYARELADAEAAVNEQGKTGVELQKQKIADAQKDIEYATQARDQADALVKSYQKQLEAKETIAPSGDAAYATNLGLGSEVPQPKQINKISDPKQVEAIQSQLRAAVQASEEFNHQIDMMKVKLQGAEIKLPSVVDKGANTAALAQLKSIESEYETLSAREASVNGHGLTANEGVAFWSQYLGTFKQGSEEAKHVMEEFVKAQTEFHKQLDSLKKKMAKGTEPEDVNMEMTNVFLNKLMNEQGEDALRTGKRWDEYNDAIAKGAEMQAQAREQFALANVHANEAAGAVTKLQAAHEIAAIHAADYAAKLQALNEQLDRLKQEENQNTANDTVDPKNSAQQQQVTNQINQLKAEMRTSAVTDQAAIQQAIQAPYLAAFSNINSQWLKVQDQMLYSTRNIGLAFAKMGQNLTVDAMNSLERFALKAIENDLRILISKRVTNQLQVQSTAQTAAEAGAINQAAGLKEAMIDAKNAAVKGWKAGMNFPFPADLVMAPLLAGVGLAGAIAQFEDGTGYVPRDGMAYLHEGEAVVPAPTVQELRGDDSGANISITQHNNWSAGDRRDFQRQLYENASHVAGAVKRHMRQGGR
jgi:hypothetical protein